MANSKKTAQKRAPMKNKEGQTTAYASACDRCSAAFFGVPGVSRVPDGWLVVAVDVQDKSATSQRCYCADCAPGVRKFLESRASGASVKAWLTANPSVRPAGVAP